MAGLEGDRRQHTALDQVRWMPEDRRFFAADPFILPAVSGMRDLSIFYENFSWSDGVGRIDTVTYNAGYFGEPKVALDSKLHLSYPFIYRHNGRYVVVPEHSASKDVSFYAIDPTGVIREKKTIGHHLEWVDSTILHFNEKYWIFATHAGSDDNSALYIYYSDNLFGPWSMHRQNPVKTDRSNSRPAGQFIFRGGDVFRPAQDCSSHYGAGIVVNRIEVLTEDQFVEQPVSEIRPRPGDRYDYGLHTISSGNGYTVIDGARMESSLSPFLDRYSHLFRA